MSGSEGGRRKSAPHGVTRRRPTLLDDFHRINAILEELALPRIGLGLVTDANIYANEASLPVVCCGPEYATTHSDHERVSVERLHRTAGLYALAAMEFCGVERYGASSPGSDMAARK